jgi:hypothetical protein
MYRFEPALELLNASSEEALNFFIQVEKRNIKKLGQHPADRRLSDAPYTS